MEILRARSRGWAVGCEDSAAVVLRVGSSPVKMSCFLSLDPQPFTFQEDIDEAWQHVRTM
jgi:hypothetical protein